MVYTCAASCWHEMEPLPEGILYSEKLLREKLLQISSFVGIVFSTKFWGVASFGVAKVSNPQNFLPRKFPIFTKPLFCNEGEKMPLFSFPLLLQLKAFQQPSALCLNPPTSPHPTTPHPTSSHPTHSVVLLTHETKLWVCKTAHFSSADSLISPPYNLQ